MQSQFMSKAFGINVMFTCICVLLVNNQTNIVRSKYNWCGSVLWWIKDGLAILGIWQKYHYSHILSPFKYIVFLPWVSQHISIFWLLQVDLSVIFENLYQISSNLENQFYLLNKTTLITLCIRRFHLYLSRKRTYHHA